MSNYNYDSDKLISFDEFDSIRAEANFSERSDYYARLDEFVDKWPHYLRDYNPTVVIYGEDVQKQFVEDMAGIKSFLTSLEMTRSLAEIENLENAIATKDAKELSDGFLKFYATLEIAANKLVSARITEAETDSLEKPAILAVDDMPLMLEAIKNILSPKYKVLAVASGAVALKALESHSPSLFLLDIEMPEMNGFELVEKIREMDRFKDVPIIFLTGMATKELVIKAKEQGINDYIIKPIVKDVLLQKIKAHLR